MISNNDYLLFLNQFLYDTPRLCHQLLERFPTHADFNSNKTSIISNLPPAKQKRLANIHTDQSSLKQTLKNMNIGILCLSDPNYPHLLKEIHSPPPLLYYKGNLYLLKNDCLAVVGTRTPSPYGKDVTTHFVTELSTHFTIVSGLASGVDGIAHKIALKSAKSTIAVIGTGLNVIYPSDHTALTKNIHQNGLVLSEFPLHTKGFAQHFPQRNRIISGLSKGTLICEGKHKSGSLITANFANEQNRDVFAIPGSIFSALSEGPNRLIQEGAKACQSPNDICEEYNIQQTPLSQQKNTPIHTTTQLNETETQVLTCISKEDINVEKKLKIERHKEVVKL